jgi:pimeloyl-ACP methyl ester carboxylesterase
VPPEVAPSFSHWEAAIVAYIEQNHIDHPVIIGHSLGGGLALAIAADYPKVPSAIVVVDALPCLAALTMPAFASDPNNDCSATIQRFTSMPDSEFKIMQQRTMPSLVADTSKVGMLVNWSVLSDRRTFATIYCDFMNTDLRNKIKNITCPALILLESAFAGIKQPIAEQYKNLAAAQLSYADKGLHFIMFDDKDWYLQQLNTFIK